jgi:exonuclease III
MVVLRSSPRVGSTHLADLAGRGKPVVLYGDLNVGHLDADIWNVTAKVADDDRTSPHLWPLLFLQFTIPGPRSPVWQHIPKSAGLTPRERAAFGTLLADGPYIDCFRQVRAIAARTPRTRRTIYALRRKRLRVAHASHACTYVHTQLRVRVCALLVWPQLWPDATGCFSYWSTRSGNELLNRGLRLDYAVASASIAEPGAPLALHDCAHLAEYAPKGDHAPTLVALRKAA